MHLKAITDALSETSPLIFAWLCVYATFTILRLFTRAAFAVTTALVAAFVVIGVLNS